MIQPEFSQNRAAQSLEKLIPYEGKYVAWTPDGKDILAAADQESELYRLVDAKGITDYVVDYIPDPGVSDLGSAGL